jgi:hypothetical protein
MTEPFLTNVNGWEPTLLLVKLRVERELVSPFARTRPARIISFPMAIMLGFPLVENDGAFTGYQIGVEMETVGCNCRATGYFDSRMRLLA